MKKYELLFTLAALVSLTGCASFNSGDIKVDRETAMAMLSDRAVVPFSDIQVSWQGFPYRDPSEYIGEGSASKPKPAAKPVPAEPGETAELARDAKAIFKEAGLYDREKGRGALRLQLTSFGRWTYGDLFRSFLVDTGFIFIIPSSLRVNYFLTADFATAAGPVRVETEGRNKTTFHLLMAPLYPLFTPGRRENGLLKQMLWRSATDVYSRLKASGGAPAELPAKPAPVEKTPVLSGPPVPPDRTWLPDQTETGESAADAAKIVPQPPDKTWVVPAKQSDAPAPAQIKPAPADRAWETKPAPEETPDD
ncbi:MAG: hypothetical protein A2X35_06310 [Elusimicrobia bacterium GWA2_61_42]|nr:MAG: hypothetical protein A2X35_06310 [Elusimicrobia bacterium GWA2_61_42]OGR78765.1 MAG: hypothetical protein A2X38_04255 [Elusimicrobia bacterium GWC2_61_25]